jgi:hypothetical protein
MHLPASAPRLANSVAAGAQTPSRHVIASSLNDARPIRPQAAATAPRHKTPAYWLQGRAGRPSRRRATSQCASPTHWGAGYTGRKSGPVRFFSTTQYPAGRDAKHRDISSSVFFESNFRTQSVQGGSRRAPLVVTIHRRPLYSERWNALSMQHDAVTAADLEHCRRWLLEAASHCSSCGA